MVEKCFEKVRIASSIPKRSALIALPVFHFLLDWEIHGFTTHIEHGFEVVIDTMILHAVRVVSEAVGEGYDPSRLTTRNRAQLQRPRDGQFLLHHLL